MNESIFAVDDSMLNLAILDKGLRSEFDITTIQSGQKLFTALENKIPDLILLDVTMPGMDGFEVLEKLKESEEYKNIPVIFLTGITDEKVELKGFELGAVDFVSKPFSMPILVNRINLHVGIDRLIKDRTSELEAKSVQLMATQKEIEDMHRNLLFVLADLVENRDKDTGGHVYRTIKYTEILLYAMLEQGVYKSEIETWDIENILTCVALHDIGKISVSDMILNKPGKLTLEEFEIMKTHSAHGAEIIDSVISRIGDNETLTNARTFAEFHHENWDGSGYPHGLKGLDIPLHGRIMAITDVYDALVSERAYKKPFTAEEAVNIIMADSGRKFDPEIALVFFSVKDKFAEVHVKK